MKKTFKEVLPILGIVVVFIGLLIIAIFQHNPDLFRREMTEEERLEFIAIGDRALLAQNMMFDNNSGYVRHDLGKIITLDSRFDDIILVETWQEGLDSDLPPNVIVAWPTPYSTGMLEHMNHLAIVLGVDLEYHGLTYPIMMYDVVHNWAIVRELYLHHLYMGVRSHAYRYFGEAQQEYRNEIAAARRERGIPEPVRWRPPWEE